MLSQRINKTLIVAAGLNMVAALLHLAIILGGAAWYRFFGAGEDLSKMAEMGSSVPDMLAGVMAILLFICSAYALSGADILRKLPLLRTVLLLIAILYILRGLLPAWLYVSAPDTLTAFIYASSAFCLMTGILHAVGLLQVWEDIYYRPSAW